MIARALAWLLAVLAWAGPPAPAQVPAQRPPAPTALETTLAGKVNEMRRGAGARELALDPLLCQVAREHSAWMQQMGKVSHESALPDRRTPAERYTRAFGKAAAKLEELVAVLDPTFSEEMLAINAHLKMNVSPEGFAITSSGEVSTIGVGCAVGPDGRVWVTELFAQPAGRAAPRPRAAPQPVDTSRLTSAEWLEELLVAGVNAERDAEIMTRLLKVDLGLREVAREHSGYMLSEGRVTHESTIRGRRTTQDRYEWATGSPPTRLYESVAVLEPGTKDEVVAAGMTALRGCREAERHSDAVQKDGRILIEGYRNMLDRDMLTIAVGCVLGADGRFWVTALYAGEPNGYQHYLGSLSSEVAETIYKLLDSESAVRAEAVRLGLPVTRFELTWHGQPVKRGDPLQFEFIVNRPGRHVGPGWGGRAELQFDLGDLNQRNSVYGVVGQRYLAEIGVLEDDGRIHGTGTVGTLMHGTAWAWTENEIKVTWEGLPTDPSRRQYQLYFDDGTTRALIATAQRKGSSLPEPDEVEPDTEVAAAEPANEEPGAEPADDAAWGEDEERAADVRWIASIDRALRAAARKKDEARELLALQRMAADRIERRIALLRQILSKLDAGESENYVEAAFALAIEVWDEATQGPPPELGGGERAVLEREVGQLSEQLADVRREQDELIAETLETYYGGLAHELEVHGQRSSWESVRRFAAETGRDVGALRGLAKAELYFAAGRRPEFREAARQCIGEGRFVAQARFLEALDAYSRGETRQALAGFRRAEAAAGSESGLKARDDPLSVQAHAMARSLEGGYLNSIAAKGAGELAQLRGECGERLKAGDHSGWMGLIVNTCRIGLAGIASELTGREDALVELAGKYEDDAAAQQTGLLILQSLHERGAELSEIAKLDQQGFQALLREKFGAASAKLAGTDALRMRVAVKAALSMPDVARLVGNSRSPLDVDTGADTLAHTEFADSLEGLGDFAVAATDVVSIANVLTMVMPTSTLRVGGKLAKFECYGLYGERLAAAGKVVTAREGFAAATGLSRIPELFAQTRTGAALMRQSQQFFARSTWLENRALDLSLNLVAGTAGEAAGGTIGVALGGDGKPEAETGRLLAELLVAWTAGDAEELGKAVQAHGLDARHLQPVAAEARALARSGAELAEEGTSRVSAVHTLLPEEPGAGIAPPAREAARVTRERAAEELADLRRRLAAGEAAEPLFRRVEQLEIAVRATAAAEQGLEAQSRAWLELLEQVNRGTSTKPAGALASAIEDAVPSARPAPGGAAASGPVGAPAEMPTLRGAHPLTAEADRLVVEQRFSEAAAEYERRLALLRQLNLADSPQARAAAIPHKLAMLEQVRKAQGVVDGWGERQVSRAHLESISREQVAAFESDPHVVLRKRTESSTFSEPYWVVREVDGKVEKLGLFKPAHPKMGGADLEGEEAFTALANACGVNVPACVRCSMRTPDGLSEGIFVRFAEGVDLKDLGPFAPLLYKEGIAQDRVLAVWLLDHDRKPDNFLALAKDQLAPIDHSMAVVRDWGGELDPVLGESASEAAMRHKLLGPDSWRNRNPYLKTLEEQLTIEDMRGTLERVRALCEEEGALEKLLLPILKDEGAVRDAAQVLRQRAKLLDKVLDDGFGSVDKLAPLPLARATARPARLAA